LGIEYRVLIENGTSFANFPKLFKSLNFNFKFNLV